MSLSPPPPYGTLSYVQDNIKLTGCRGVDTKCGIAYFDGFVLQLKTAELVDGLSGMRLILVSYEPITIAVAGVGVSDDLG